MALHASHARTTQYRLAAPAWQCSRSKPFSLAKHINGIAALSFVLRQAKNKQRNTTNNNTNNKNNNISSSICSFYAAGFFARAKLEIKALCLMHKQKAKRTQTQILFSSHTHAHIYTQVIHTQTALKGEASIESHRVFTS